MLHRHSAVMLLTGSLLLAGCNNPSEPETFERAPNLPTQMFRYAMPLPEHFSPGVPNSPGFADNTPANNPITDAGATLGRVLFYDKRLSANQSISCASCHHQALAFADSAALSRGFNGRRTARHTMGLSNARFYVNRRFFWDERAVSLEAQVLQPIQDTVEMGLPLDQMTSRINATSFYPPLFAAAFGSSVATPDLVARALAQFIRSMVTAGSKFDAGVTSREGPPFTNFTQQERLGMQVFNGVGGCARCHFTSAQIAPAVFNNGLDATITDAGAGNGRFKAPSLRNIELTAPYMHDGRFATLEQVVDHYDAGVKVNPGLDPGLRAIGGGARRLNLTTDQKAALVAFLKTLTDRTFVTDPRFADPFL
jgi:cytochrome c peroxidase